MSALNQFQILYLETALGRDLAPSEIAYLGENKSSETGIFDLDDRPPGGRKVMVFYTACTGVQMRYYIRTHRPEVFEQYDLHNVFCHALSLRSSAPDFKVPEIIPAMFKSADALIYNPVDAAYEPLSHTHIIRTLKPECKVASFGGPHHGCWWPICPFFGEEPVVDALEAGFSVSAIWELMSTGGLELKFEERFNQQMAFLKGYQHGTDVRMTEFIADCYKRCKLFFTFNHPTCHLLAFLADECLGQMGFERRGREHAISVVKADDCMVGDVYPETHYEWEHYKFEYPMRWSERMGGINFYYGVIQGIEDRWKAKKA